MLFLGIKYIYDFYTECNQDQTINTIVSLDASNGFEKSSKLKPFFQEIASDIIKL
ncbi:MAG: hypothetical protein ACRCTJ_03735 [Brevinema sp.]